MILAAAWTCDCSFAVLQLCEDMDQYLRLFIMETGPCKSLDGCIFCCLMAVRKCAEDWALHVNGINASKSTGAEAHWGGHKVGAGR